MRSANVRRLAQRSSFTAVPIKQLSDQGVITEEEFLAKKKQLLEQF
jgi:hypothetical protein